MGLSHETSGRAAKDDSASHTQPGTKKPTASAVCKPSEGRACAFLLLNLLQFPGNSSGQAHRALQCDSVNLKRPEQGNPETQSR